MTHQANPLREAFGRLPVVGGHHLNAELLAWAGKRIEYLSAELFGPAWALGIHRGGALVAVAVYHSLDTACGTAQMSMAADTPRWASRPLIGALLGFGFERLNGPGGAHLRKLNAVCPSTNERVLRFNAGIGFRREAILSHQFDWGVHAHVFGMTERAWRKRYKGDA